MAARTILSLLERNRRWEQQSGIRRQIASNMPLAPEFVAQHEGWFRFWTTLDEVVALPNTDVIFDEVANKFDARNWMQLPDNVKLWLRHHDKDGVEIYANTQHYEAVDVQFRRLVNRLYVVSKIIGSGRPAATKPPIRHVWGIIAYQQHDPKTYSFQADNAGAEKVKSAISWPGMFWISRKLVDIYYTSHKIPADSTGKLRHIVKVCDEPFCEYHTRGKVIHV